MANIDDKYIKIQGWMVNQLELTGSELMIYARIYSFQFREMEGKDIKREAKPVEISTRDFMDWTRINKPNVIKTIQKLESKGLIKVSSIPGHVSSYSVNIGPIKKSTSGIANDTSIKTIPVSSGKQCGIADNTTGGIANDTRVVSLASQSGIARETLRQPTTKTTKKTTKTTTRTRVQSDASASLSSTDTEDGYEDLSKSEIAFFEKQALKKLNETDETTGQKLYLTKDPRDQFPKAFLFMTAKDTNQFTDTEFELFKMVSMYTAFGPAKPLPTVSEEDAKCVPPASEIGQEAHDAQQALVDWLFEGGPSPSSYAHDAPLQSRRQK